MSSSKQFHVIKRDGSKAEVCFDKITQRIKRLTDGNITHHTDISGNLTPLSNVNYTSVAQRTIRSLKDGMTTRELDDNSAENAMSLSTQHFEYGELAARIAISDLHKNTARSMRDLFHVIAYTPESSGMLHPRAVEVVREFGDQIDSMIDYSRDYLLDFFGINTLKKSYLLRIDNEVVERPQHMWMRCAIQIHLLYKTTPPSPADFARLRETYDAMSTLTMTHATPTLFNSCTMYPQLSSCNLLGTYDSVEEIFDTLKTCANLGKCAAGIGLNFSRVRADGSLIRTTNRPSRGVMPFMRIFNTACEAVDQARRRKFSIAMYLEVFHADVLDFIDIKKNTGAEEMRCRNLFHAIYATNLFFDRVRANETWSLMCPDECPGLVETYGDEFTQKYEQYEREGKFKAQMPARELFDRMIESMIETGGPYVVNKDECNQKCNQKNLGTIQCSNLCVAGETRILTNKGYHPIKTLEGAPVTVWNGEEWSKTTVMRTSDAAKLVEVKIDDNCTLKCTPYHNFHIIKNNKEEVVKAEDLEKGDIIAPFKLPVIKEGHSIPAPYASGYFAGAGFHSLSGEEYITVRENKMFALDKLEFDTDQCIKTPCGVSNLKLQEIYHHVPINADFESKKKWLEGYIESQFSYINHNLVISKSISSSQNYRKVLMDLRLMLQTMGIPSFIERFLENISICVSARDLVSLNLNLNISVSFSTKQNMKDDLRVSSVKETDYIEPTFCFTEPLKHTGMFEGVMTGQCSEITIYSDKDNIGTCNLMSIALPKCVRGKEFHFEKLGELVRIGVRNLNNVIDGMFYPDERCKNSNMQNRPIGIGIQGLADTFAQLRLPFDSDGARKLNRDIAECIYYNAVSESCNLGVLDGVYDTFWTSPAAKGELQHDMWGVSPALYSSAQWDSLRKRVMSDGMRNSLLIALMPTAGTSQLLGNSESFDPNYNNIYTRYTMSGSFTIVNKHLVQDLTRLGLWSEEMKNRIVEENGSLANIPEIPKETKDIFKTVWEISPKTLIDYAAERGPWVCQTQSMNLYMAVPDATRIGKAILYGQSKGLKTLCYYFRSLPAMSAMKFTVDPTKKKEVEEQVCRMEEGCISCSA